MKNPLLNYNGFELREEIPRDPENPDFEAEVQWLYEWIEVFISQQVQIRNRRKYGVYLAAILNQSYSEDVKVADFLRDGPDQILGIYWGCDSSGSININNHHIEKKSRHLSPLGRAADQGLTVVCLYREDFEGEWEDKARRMKEKEAQMIVGHSDKFV